MNTNTKVIGVLDKGSKEVPIYVIFPFGHLLVKVVDIVKGWL